MEKKNKNKLIENFSNLLDRYHNIEYGRKLNPVDAFFAYRILIGRNPDLNIELPGFLSNDRQTFREFLKSLLNSDEFKNNTSFLPPDKELMVELSDFRFWFNSSDREMGVRMAFGRYEPETVNLLSKIVKPGMKCLDAGAQTGFYTCILASRVGETGKVYAFEPMPSNYQLLVKNVEENNFENTVQHYQLACSDSAKTIRGSMVSNMYVAGNVGTGEKITMESVRVDDVIKDSIDIIKIDIEGHEPAGVNGMRSIITKDKPVIFSEINEYWLRTCSNSSSSQYAKQLNSLGYDVYDVEALDEPITDELRSMDILDTMDIIAFPKGSRLSDYS